MALGGRASCLWFDGVFSLNFVGVRKDGAVEGEAMSVEAVYGVCQPREATLGREETLAARGQTQSQLSSLGE